MRVCWNWQTGTFEGRVLHDVRVQVPSLAPNELQQRQGIVCSLPCCCISDYPPIKE